MSTKITGEGLKREIGFWGLSANMAGTILYWVLNGIKKMGIDTTE